MLRLSYKETEALFRLVHCVPEQRTRALFARFKAFQQLDFPPRERVGRGSRIGYTFDQLLQLLSAFELLQAGAMPSRAARSVATTWPEQRRAYALGWAALREMVAVEDSCLLASTPAALAEMGGEPEQDAPVPDPLRPVARATVAAWALRSSDGKPTAGGTRPPASRLVVDPLLVAASLGDLLPKVVAVTAEDVDEAFRALGIEAFGDASPRRWASGWKRTGA